jgi:hypothetical protein
VRVGSPRLAPVPILVVALLLAACVLPPLPSPTPIPTPTQTPSPTPSPSPTSAPSPTASPTPDFGAVPEFTAGELVVTAIDGLRIRQRPGVSANVVTGLLPLNARLGVVLGPIPTDDLGWYLVTDADAAEPDFDEGWIAAGFEPEAWLASTGETAGESRLLSSFAHTGDAENGPVAIGRGNHAIRWVAVDPEGIACSFEVSLAEGRDEPVPAIRATIGDDLVPGTLQPDGFDDLDVRGQVFVSVVSDCAWALVIERVRRSEATGSP